MSEEGEAITVFEHVRKKEERIRRWHEEHPGRAAWLNDAMDACANMQARRELFASLSKDDRDGMMQEYMRRGQNRVMMPGELVRSHGGRPALIRVAKPGDGEELGGYVGLACVVGQDDGTDVRYLWLYTPWTDKDGGEHVFAKARCYDLDEVR